MEFGITQPVDGEIINHAVARDIDGGFEIEVCGTAPPGMPLTVNGKKAERNGDTFRAKVAITRDRTVITAVADGPHGSLRHRIVVFADFDHRLRYRFSVDDNILFLKDIARHSGTYKSIFDCWYLAFWKQMHERYGARIQFNIYWQTNGFNLTEMPDKYRSEWRDNADWIKLTFHARADMPPKPYVTTPYEIIRSDFLAIAEQIERFAGPELLSDFTTVHWGSANRESCRALRDNGIRGLVGYFRLQNGVPYVAYYLDDSHTRFIASRDYWVDTSEDIIFIRTDMVVNELPIGKIRPNLDEIYADPKRAQLMELMIHEQYFWERTGLLQPDAKQKVETALQWLNERGYEPVFFDEVF